MYTKEQVVAGIILYLKKELLPMLPDGIRMVAGAVLLHNTMRLNDLINAFCQNGWGAALGLLTPDGGVDLDMWAQNCKTSMREFCGGRITIKLPMAAPIYFTESDIDTVKRYVRGDIA